MTSSNISSNPQPKESQLTVIEEERNQEIFTIRKLEDKDFTA